MGLFTDALRFWVQTELNHAVDLLAAPITGAEQRRRDVQGLAAVALAHLLRLDRAHDHGVAVPALHRHPLHSPALREVARVFIRQRLLRRAGRRTGSPHDGKEDHGLEPPPLAPPRLPPALALRVPHAPPLAV